MAQYNWFGPIESMFYEASEYHDIPGWTIEPIPNNVNTRREALTQGQRREWPFRSHNAKAKFKCHNCGKQWASSYTTIIWRARWDIAIVQLKIEKQGCQKCNQKCQGFLTDGEAVAFAIYCMCTWILEVFYGIKVEKTSENGDEPNKKEDLTAPHDLQRCEAGKKGTCRKCRLIKQHLRLDRP